MHLSAQAGRSFELNADIQLKRADYGSTIFEEKVCTSQVAERFDF